MPEINKPLGTNPALPNRPIPRSGGGEMTGGVREGVPIAPSRAGEVSETSAPARPEGAPTLEGEFRSPQARPITAEDIRGHLINIQVQDTDFNVRLASMMLRYGVELSRENFQTLQQMLEGTHKGLNMQESALVLLGKGIHNPQAVVVLGEFLAQNPKLAEQILAAARLLSGLQSMIQGNQVLLNPQLSNQLASLLAQFEKGLGKMGGEGAFGSSADGSSDRADLLNDLRAMRSIIQAIQERMLAKNPQQSGNIHNTMMSTLHSLDGLMNNVVAQALLSQSSGRGDLGDVKYLYHQIPNLAAKPPQTVEMLIRKDGQGPAAKIDPANTQIVLSLETPQLGRITVNMSVKDKSVGFTFFTQSDETRTLIARESIRLKDQLNNKGFQARSVHTRSHPTLSTIRPYLIPLAGLDDLMRVDARI